MVACASAKSNAFGPGANSAAKRGSCTNRSVAMPRRPAIAWARSISSPRAATTSRPFTAPTWKPSLGMFSPTVRVPGVTVAGRRGRGRRERERQGEQRGEEGSSHDLARTRTGVPTERKSNSHRASKDVTRTHPCEAAWTGTSGYSWNAMPPTK